VTRGIEGKVACITGAARGQGRCHAERLAQEGADIIAVDACAPIATVPYAMPTPEDLAETASLVRATGRRIVTAQADVRDLASLTDAVDAGVEELGRLDIVIANAGISTTAPTLDMSEEMWATMIDVNLSGVWKTLKAAVPHVVRGGRGGAVVITSSIATEISHENTAHYTASKHGLVGLMRVLAKELAPHGIRVNSLQPTTVATDMVLNDTIYRLFRPDLENPTRDDFEEAAQAINALPVPMLEPIDVANAVVHLVSDAGRYITGTTQVLDAGASL
jgi:SDR family mycofactocin-dependent oxidoreductase